MHNIASLIIAFAMSKFSGLRLLILAGMISQSPFPGYGAEFVILNDTIEYPNNTDNNGFYFFYYNPSMPANWTSPVDYVHGEVYTRYEIISQASSEPVGLQFGIWQKLPPETENLYENMEFVRILSGPGSYVASHSSPADWWKYNGGVDFTKMDLVWHFGINPYKVVPTQLQIRQENPTVWNERFIYWFPMKVRVTVVAVSAGSQFSGWDDYLKFPAPAYTINYSGEKTNQVMPATDEYSFSPSMSPAFPGTGLPLDLEPGQTVYIRTRARDLTPQSDIQILTVPGRPSTPSFGIDFISEQTSAIISSEYEYSTNSDMSGASPGPGTEVPLEPGTDMYIRVKATMGSFASDIQTLIVPGRPSTPSFEIDYLNEETSAEVGSEYEYSTELSMSDPVTGSGTPVKIEAESTLYFRVKAVPGAFVSDIQTLNAPSRLPSPSYGIDFINEKTSAPVSTAVDYSQNPDLSGAAPGTGTAITLSPGSKMYFRTRATSEYYASEIFQLSMPPRPVILSPESGSTDKNPFIITVEFFQNADQFTTEDLEIQNAVIDSFMTASAHEQGFIGMALVTPLITGRISIRVPVNSMPQGNFRSDLFEIDFTGIISGSEEFHNRDGYMILSPNPTSGMLRISSPVLDQSEVTLSIYAISGREILTQQVFEKDETGVDLSFLSNGVYVLKLSSARGSIIQKFVFQSK